jgi:aryl-alcohol dehydrogenase-like predicted oxidoreductase
MEKKELGRSGIKVAPLALGCNVFGWTIKEAESFRVLDAFVEAGYNLIDTADVYSRWVPGNRGGESETIIGKWFRQGGKRDKVVLATKFGKEMAVDKKGLSKKYMRAALEDSLRRLQTDYIDLYQSHEDDPGTALEETMEGFAELVKEGKLKAIGASNFTAKRLTESLRISVKYGFPRYESLQPLYNLYNRAEFEKDLEPICVEQQVGVISYYSLASGFLTGKYRSENDLSKSLRGKGIGKYLNERGMAILRALDQVAGQYHSTPATIAIAWLMQSPGVTAPIASATSREQLTELIKAAELKLDGASLELLDQSSSYSLILNS